MIANVTTDICKHSQDDESARYAMLDIRLQNGKVFALRVPIHQYSSDKEMLEIFNEIAYRINKENSHDINHQS